MSVLQLLKVAV